MLRGVNLGPHRRIRMEPLRAVYESVGLTDVRTLLQSGNIVFQSKARDLSRLSARLQDAFEAEFGFRSDVFLRSADDLRKVVAGNPFEGRAGVEPARLAVTFLASAPDVAARSRLAAITGVPEELHTGERELYIYYCNGMARPALTPAMLDKALLKMSTTTRNWNTVTKMVAMAGELESSA